MAVRMAKKKFRRQVHAYELGGGSDMEKLLLEEGKIQLTGDGEYRLFSLEATESKGQLALSKDFFKVDTKETTGEKFPYPLKRQFFLENHHKVGENLFEQIPKPLKVWLIDDDPFEEISWLFKTGKLLLKREDPEHTFEAFIWDTQLSAPANAVVVIYDVKKNSEGKIYSIDFGLVQRDIFDKSYDFIA